jgi:hypothetical protein
VRRVARPRPRGLRLRRPLHLHRPAPVHRRHVLARRQPLRVGGRC